MHIILTALTIALQFIAGQLLGFGVAFYLGVGDGWELVVIGLGNALGVWMVGVIAARLRGSLHRQEVLLRLAGTVLGAAIGVALILLTPAFGYAQLLFPLVGAILGYYLAAIGQN